MNYTRFAVALVALTLVHTVVSFCAYKYFVTIRTVDSDAVQTEVTALDQNFHGEGAVALPPRREQTLRKSIPTPVVFYIWSGFLGLAASGAVAAFKAIAR